MRFGRLKVSVGAQSVILIFLLLFIDQAIKVAVKTNMCLYESIRITDWCFIHFVENNGMAYGVTVLPKLFLSTFRLLAIVVLSVYVYRLLKRKASTFYILCISIIIAGAAGNIIDSLFYGMVFSESTFNSVATFVPWGSGYSSFLYGRVVDMFYFPLFHFTFPEWLPLVGGNPYTFFSPIFNFADACISVAVVLLLIFCRKDLEQIKF